uniref:Uncharacterized protein n=1 Tax=Romanomermis culicivorax TaxID=13658 RepID=A0A915J5R7_ROMCU
MMALMSVSILVGGMDASDKISVTIWSASDNAPAREKLEQKISMAKSLVDMGANVIPVRNLDVLNIFRITVFSIAISFDGLAVPWYQIDPQIETNYLSTGNSRVTTTIAEIDEKVDLELKSRKEAEQIKRGNIQDVATFAILGSM